MRTRVKVCCIASEGEARLAIRYGSDAIGFVGPMPSGPGVIPDSLIRDIALTVPPTIETFLLTSRTRSRDIVDHVRSCGTTTVQIVRHIDPSEHEHIAAVLPTIRRVQVIHVEDEGAIELARTYAPLVHALLLDSGTPAAAVEELGGTGRTHDWAISAEVVRSVDIPVFLAGGLDPGNVLAAVATVAPFGVDLRSGIRTDGRLDEAKLSQFTANVWGALGA